jgi:hypothetical protein
VLRRGSVIWAKIPDPDGNVIYNDDGTVRSHPCLVLSSQAGIDAGKPLIVAGITSSFNPRKLPPEWIKMPHQPGGHPETSLYKPCVVKANWLVNITDRAEIENESDGIAEKEARSVLAWLKKQGII